ncbi:hypothetical protein R3P38DRAFT_2784336 [Favolaschia claudopus]|uniref:Uncharacterized protein n=1 Tax=Favolaschia claudopus TaxID=2862362 RepID=A0AAW0B015_9AGAR
MDASQKSAGNGGWFSENLSPIKQMPAGQRQKTIQELSTRLAKIQDNLRVEQQLNPQLYEHALQLPFDPTTDPMGQFRQAIDDWMRPSHEWYEKLVAATDAAAEHLTNPDPNNDTTATLDQLVAATDAATEHLENSNAAAEHPDSDAASTAATDGGSDTETIADVASDAGSDAGSDSSNATAGHEVYGPQTYFEYLTNDDDVAEAERSWARVLGCMNTLLRSWKVDLEKAIGDLDATAEAAGFASAEAAAALGERAQQMEEETEEEEEVLVLWR